MSTDKEDWILGGSTARRWDGDWILGSGGARQLRCSLGGGGHGGMRHQGLGSSTGLGAAVVERVGRGVGST
jgi:hypothetical protein